MVRLLCGCSDTCGYAGRAKREIASTPSYRVARKSVKHVRHGPANQDFAEVSINFYRRASFGRFRSLQACQGHLASREKGLYIVYSSPSFRLTYDLYRNEQIATPLGEHCLGQQICFICLYPRGLLRFRFLLRCTVNTAPSGSDAVDVDLLDHMFRESLLNRLFRHEIGLFIPKFLQDSSTGTHLEPYVTCCKLVVCIGFAKICRCLENSHLGLLPARVRSALKNFQMA